MVCAPDITKTLLVNRYRSPHNSDLINGLTLLERWSGLLTDVIFSHKLDTPSCIINLRFLRRPSLRLVEVISSIRKA